MVFPDWRQILSGRNFRCQRCKLGRLRAEEQSDGSMRVTCSFCDYFGVVPADFVKRAKEYLRINKEVEK